MPDLAQVRPEESYSKHTALRAMRQIHQRADLAILLLYTSAFLSMFDMATDITILARYYSQGKSISCYAIIICVFLNLLLQSCFVFLQNRDEPLKKKIREQLFVWLLIKPGIDAFRWARRQRENKSAFVEQIAEMTAIRLIEIVVESIPGALIQAQALLANDGDRSFIPIVALGSSISTTAFMACMISLDYDTHPGKRELQPAFYGCLPSSIEGRIASMTWMLSFSTCNLAVRTLSFVIFTKKSLVLCAAIFGGEVSRQCDELSKNYIPQLQPYIRLASLVAAHHLLHLQTLEARLHLLGANLWLYRNYSQIHSPFPHQGELERLLLPTSMPFLTPTVGSM